MFIEGEDDGMIPLATAGLEGASLKTIKNTGTPNNSAKGFNIRSYTKGATYAQINAIANSEIKAYENTLCNILLILSSILSI